MSSNSDFFSDDQNLAELVSHMPEEDQKRFNNYGHLRIEGAFVDRLFIVYKPTGLTTAGQHREPEVLNLIKIIDFGVDTRNGCYVVLKDSNTKQELTITHVPRRVYEYPLYMAVPPKTTLKWDARTVQGRIWRSMSFAVLVKARNRADFYSKGNVYMETPAGFKRLYPSVAPIDFKF